MSKIRGLHRARLSGLPSTSPLVRFIPFDEGGVLFFQGSRRLWVLNASSAFLWCALDESSSIEELAGCLADRFSIDGAMALRDASAAVAFFEQEGLLEGGQPQDLRGNELQQSAIPGRCVAQPSGWAYRCLFQTPGQVFELCCQDVSLGAYFSELVAHLAPDGNPPADTRLTVLADSRAPNVWEIHLDGRWVAGGVRPDEVMPCLFTLIFFRASAALRERLLFHAAVIGGAGRAVLFPAESGSGKTTLAAALTARGWGYFSDELAALDVSDLRVLPLPLPMSIKQGSFGALAGYCPGLAARPLFRRPDRKTVCFHLPPSLALPREDSSVPLQALIFPAYRTGAATCLRVLEKKDALLGLARTGSSNREFTARDVEAMIAVVERNPCYALAYSRLDEAVSLIEDKILKQ